MSVRRAICKESYLKDWIAFLSFLCFECGILSRQNDAWVGERKIITGRVSEPTRERDDERVKVLVDSCIS